ncbi:MAG: transposase [Burkholderiaceae bacterium]|jgi:putative transposase|nr:transposase [Burkholderiaceae bacterium]
MSNYRRAWVPGGTYFFTVNLLRRDRRLLVEHINALRDAFRQTHAKRPFDTLAIVVLPDHLHCLWRLPPGDSDNATRWSSIKALFSRATPAGEYRSERHMAKGERGIWQRRYWEHLIRDEDDFATHVNYIHFNPVKHGHVTRTADWPHSSFHRYVRRGDLPADWGNAEFIRPHDCQNVAAAGERKDA